jgi:hypothetical protein
MSTPLDDLLKNGPVVINIGVIDFGESIALQDVEIIHVVWSPPVELDEDLEQLLDELI